MATIPDLTLTGKLKALGTKCDPESNEKVIVTLSYEALRETEEAKLYLEAGAVYKGQQMGLGISGPEGFGRTIPDVSLTGMAAKTSADDSTLIRLSWGFETRASLDEMMELYADLLGERGNMHLLTGILRQPGLFGRAEVHVVRHGEAAEG